MRKIYSDRDYFEEKFGEIDRQFESIEKKLDKLYLCVYGNGEQGLIDKFRDQAAHIVWMTWCMLAMFVFMFMTHAQGAVDFITDLFKKRL